MTRNDTLEISDFPERLGKPGQIEVISETQPASPTLESIEKAYIHYVMSETGGKKTEAAKILGIDTSTLYRKIDRYKLKEFSSKKTDDAITKVSKE